MKKLIRIISLVLASVLIFSACSKESSTDIKTGADADSRNGGVLKMGCVPIDTLNPLVTEHSSIRDFLSLVYEGLFVANTDLGYTPILASEYVASNNNTTYTIKLKGGVKFHSGKSFSSEDVIATLEYLSLYTTRYSSFVQNIASYNAPSEDTVIINLKNPVSDFINTLDFPILPKGLSGADFTVGSQFFVPDGTGMYVYDSTLEYKNIYLKANENWHSDAKRAHIDKIDVEILSDEQTVISAFDAGSIDVLTTSWKSQSELSLTSNLYNTYNIPLNRLTFIGINTQVSAFDTAKERKALTGAVNSEKICEEIMLKSAVATKVPAREGIYFNEADLEDASVGEKTDSVKEAGEGEEGAKPEIFLLYNFDSKTKIRLALAVKHHLDISGYNITLNPQPLEEYLRKVSACEYDLYVGEVSIDNASNLEFMFGEERNGQNICTYSSPELSALVSNLNRMSGKENKSIAWENFEKYYLDNAFQVSLYFTKGAVYVNKRVKGKLNPNLSSLLYGFEDLYIEE